MTSDKVAVIVPGILGSALYYARAPNNLELWGENLITNYRRLCDQATLLDWNRDATPANSSLLKSIRASLVVTFKKATLYDKLATQVRQLADVSNVVECSYDWRDSVLNSCSTVITQIQRTYPSDLSTPPRSGDPQIMFLSHSLGGLVVKAAVAKGLIHPARIDRVIYIGTPLFGAPAAFRSLYSDVNLPFFSEFATLFRALEKENFKAHLLSSFRTFRSLAELLPHEHIDFICYSALSRSNPLRETYMDLSIREGAEAAHKAFRLADIILQSAKVRTFSIYTSACTKINTETEYSVKAIAMPNGYEITDVYHKDYEGDGTVPAYSAKGDENCQRLRVTNCSHAFMCDSRPVLDAIAKTASKMTLTAGPNR